MIKKSPDVSFYIFNKGFNEPMGAKRDKCYDGQEHKIKHPVAFLLFN